jgi:hypothetical protein
MANEVENVQYYKDMEQGTLELNGQQLSFGRRDSQVWDERNFRARREYAVRVARDYNMSDGFYVTGYQLRSMVHRLEHHEARLVKPAV